MKEVETINILNKYLYGKSQKLITTLPRTENQLTLPSNTYVYCTIKCK